MKRNSGFTMIEILGILAIVAILVLIIVPAAWNYRQKAYNNSAEQMARNFKTSQGAYLAQHAVYATELSDLLTVDPNLLDTPGLTYLWVSANTSGYTFNVTHRSGNRWYTVQP